ncbi:MAG TPA: hypothetical protein VKB86_17330 [Pyrinomonadaceae bacterium]|nr:hypothetical protein [Pyrinomonadaceae bacterium]
MNKDERQDESVNEEQSTSELSPSEKFKDVKPSGSLIPGAQNPESEEIKSEINPNTE